MHIRSVGIVGYGNFGAFVHVLLKRFAPMTKVRVFEPKKKPDGKVFFSMSEVAVCDAIILAVPIRVFETAVKKLLPHLGPNTILVDVSTVKSHPLKILKRLAKGRPYISTHPMWGPESYKKRGGDVSGFRIVVSGHTLSEKAIAAFCKKLERIGFKILRMSAEAHDKNLAETLFLTHFVGQIISKAGFVRTDVDTVSFGYLMDAVESVKNDTQLFKDVFAYVPHCKEVLRRIGIAEKYILASLT